MVDRITASNFDPKIIKKEIKKSRMNINEQDTKGRTLLMIMAAISPNSQAVETLLSMGADPRLKDEDGFTALDYARNYNNHEAEELLNALRQFIS